MMNAFHSSSSDAQTTSFSARIPLTPKTLRSVRAAADVNLSPDGQRVAFVIGEYVAGEQLPHERIWTAETTGGNPQLLTKGPSDSGPRWSLDGQHLAFIAVRDKEGNKGKPQLYLVPAQGGEARRVCVMPNGVINLAWAPDSARLAFLSLEGEDPPTDPQVILPERHRRLWTIGLNDDLPQPVTPDTLTIWEYAWSPDSRDLAVYYSLKPGESGWFSGQIGIVAARGSAVRQLTQLTRQAVDVHWSPDGTRLAYISGEISDSVLTGGDVFTISRQGGEPRNVTPGVTISPGWCRWFPDGQHLLYTAWDGLSHQIGILDEAGGTITPLVTDFVIGEAFRPYLSATTDLRRFATLHSPPEHPNDIWFGELTSADDIPSGVHWRRLSHLNPLIEETTAIPRRERVRYKSVDGWQIEGLLMLPPVSRTEGPPPLIVHVHGGPTWAFSDDWQGWRIFSSHLMAAAGYAVFMPNIRGSIGRGVAFADAVIGDPGGKDLQDILSGVDYLVAHGLVDGERVGIAGWSYGGLMAAWAITQTRRFKAAVVGAGVTDWHSQHAQASIADWDTRFLKADPFKNPEVYREHSAITYATRATTPTLILHGERDQFVPVSQASAFQRALQAQHVPVELVLYPREDHVFLEYDHLCDVDERTVRWFDRHL